MRAPCTAAKPTAPHPITITASQLAVTAQPTTATAGTPFGGITVKAEDSSGNVDTNTVEKAATTAASPDVTPPVFAGLATASGLSDTTIGLTWAAATDDYSPPAQIVYDIFTASAAGGETLSSPTYTSDPGATSFVITGLLPQTQEYIVVRARDQAGKQTLVRAANSGEALLEFPLKKHKRITRFALALIQFEHVHCKRRHKGTREEVGR